MEEGSTRGGELSELLEEIYKSTESLELGCAEINCFMCAKGGNLSPCQRLKEAVVLLPWENQLIRSLNGRAFPEISLNGFSLGFLPPEEDCLFNKGGWCTVHGKHPIDCRSFPIVPSVNQRGDLIVSISIKCPIVPSWKFTKTWVENWRRIWKVVPLEWFFFYSEVPTSPLKPIALFKVEERG
ncbi:MAG: hypothetical protein D6674_07775 [Acidobacteria bacterium]|jgi:Fe-S-cluster containining protein|nr:MAG: hypothetical protein D6674_07775 [Acidobacteriota bacterium]